MLGKTHVELFAQLQTFFIGEYAKGRRIILIIDEAQNLSLDMLEELRLLSNINAGKDQLLQLILVGQPELKGLLNRPELVQLAQRVGSDFHLTPLNKAEVRDYIETRLSIAGCERRVFTDRAIELIADQSRGVPRVINIIADTALVYAFSAEDPAVGVETIQNVIRDKTDFGVFGIAANEPSTPPIKSSARSGPDAFVNDTGSEPSHHVEEPRRPNRAPPRQSVQETRPSSQNPTSEAPSSSTARQPEVIGSKDRVRAEETAPEAETKPATQATDRTVLTEATAITGIVVVGANPRISPEAAVRSAGDGRAVVFVSVGAGEEAISQAKKAGAIVVEGDPRSLSPGGRARNAGYRQLKKIAPHIRYVQFIDSENALDPDWISNAERFMERRSEVTIVEGVFQTAPNQQAELATINEARQKSISGEAALNSSANLFVRTEKFEAVGGFRGDLLMRETDDLCVRLRRRGGRVWRIDYAMLVTGAAKPAHQNWWKTGARRGFGNAYIASLHGGPPERVGVRETARAVFWGFTFPSLIIVAALASGIGSSILAPTTPFYVVSGLILAFGAGVYALKIVASAFLRGVIQVSSWRKAFSVVFGKFPEFSGVWRFWFSGERPPRAR